MFEENRQEMIDHRTYKEIKHMNREAIDAFCRRIAKRGIERGIKLASIALFYALHKECGFGNARIERVFDRQAILLNDMWHQKIRVEELQDELVRDKIVCLKEDE